jgi:hypothetical protein
MRDAFMLTLQWVEKKVAASKSGHIPPLPLYPETGRGCKRPVETIEGGGLN